MCHVPSVTLEKPTYTRTLRNHNFVIKYCRTSIYIYSFYPLCIKVQNSLPDNV